MKLHDEKNFSTMYNNPAYWRHMGWGEPAALNGVVHYVYASRNTATGDPGDVFYIRSTDKGQTFSAPFQLNTNTDPTRAQWQPNLSVNVSGSLFAVWYDERERTAASCQPSSPGTPVTGCGRAGPPTTARPGSPMNRSPMW